MIFKPLLYLLSQATFDYIEPVLEPKTEKLHKYKCKVANDSKWIYNIEFVERIIIDDKEGLERLLDVTAEDSELEWGTVLESHDDKDRAIMHRIMDPEEAVNSGYIRGVSRTSILFDMGLVHLDCFNGTHHYHPKLLTNLINAANFAVNQNDRAVSQPGWINLISFNMPKGPEVIGYNLQYTYIPANKEKTELVKATPMQITRYLLKQ